METKVNLIENRLFVRLDNEWYERPVKYVEYKGDKTND